MAWVGVGGEIGTSAVSIRTCIGNRFRFSVLCLRLSVKCDFTSHHAFLSFTFCRVMGIIKLLAKKHQIPGEKIAHS